MVPPFPMATVTPFAALRPDPALAAKVCELPYDVMSSEEARVMADGNPLSFLRVSKPEIDLPEGTDLYSDEVYAKGRENFLKLIADGVLRRDPVADVPSLPAGDGRPQPDRSWSVWRVVRSIWKTS